MNRFGMMNHVRLFEILVGIFAADTLGILFQMNLAALPIC